MTPPTDARTADAAITNPRTSKREVILGALQGGEDFLSAQDIHANLRAVGHNVGLATVYRTLQALLEEGQVDALRNEAGEVTYRSCEWLAESGEIDSVVSPSGEVWYRGCASDNDRLHHHLVCRICGRGVDLESPEVNAWIESVSRQNLFIAVDRTVQLSGMCDDCSSSPRSG